MQIHPLKKNVTVPHGRLTNASNLKTNLGLPNLLYATVKGFTTSGNLSTLVITPFPNELSSSSVTNYVLSLADLLFFKCVLAG